MSLDDFTALARSRRTSLLVDTERKVPVELVQRLCDLAQWAPNHKRTWPWRFALFTQEGRAKLGEAFVADMIAVDFGDEGKRLKTRTKYQRAPAVLLVGAAAHPKPSLDEENRYSTAALIENVLLGATAAGLASFWSTPPLERSPSVLSLAGFEPDTTLIGVLYLGWPSAQVETPDRPPV